VAADVGHALLQLDRFSRERQSCLGAVPPVGSAEKRFFPLHAKARRTRRSLRQRLKIWQTPAAQLSETLGPTTVR